MLIPVLNSLPENIDAANATNKTKLPAIDWDDYYADLIWYWSGGAFGGSSFWGASIDVAYYADYKDMGYLDWISKGDILVYRRDQVLINGRVRAFRRF